MMFLSQYSGSFPRRAARSGPTSWPTPRSASELREGDVLAADDARLARLGDRVALEDHPCALLALVRAPPRSPRRLEPGLVSSALLLGAPTIVHTLGALILSVGDRFMIALLIDTAAVGRYHAMYVLSSAGILEPRLEHRLRFVAQAEDARELKRYYLFPATKGELLRRLGRRSDADTQFRRAIELAPNEPVRRFLPPAHGRTH